VVLSAQEAPVLEGRLLFRDAPADSGTVVLHRVTPAEAGPLDSVQVDAEGRFRLVLPEVLEPGSGEVYFGSVRREGILYYGEPLTASEQLAEAYVIRSYPTRRSPPGGLPLSVGVRNVFVEEGPVGWLLTDLIQVRNDSTVTFVTDEGTGPLWRYPLPPGARAFRPGQAEVNPDAVEFRDGGLELMGPLIPGERLLVIQYDVEDLEFSLPLPGRTESLEVFLREPAPGLRMEGLTPRRAVELEPGSTYRRWTGEDLEDRVVRVREGEERPEPFPGWLAVGLALVLAAAGIWAILRTGAGPASSAPPRDPDG